MAEIKEYSFPFDSSFFQEISGERKPVILRKLEIGAACEKWTPEYLASAIGSTQVKIHVCPVPQMDFLTKNFQYKTMPFDDFIKRVSKQQQDDFFISPEEKYYLRSIASSNPRKCVADINNDFPQISMDVKAPGFIPLDKFYSSVFRIGSANMQLWTHYDVMDNVLIQISGRKRVVLFSPQDALNLYLSGDKSEVIDIDRPDLEKYPKFMNAKRYECVLQPGDGIFIPAMWFHNVIALDFSIAINMFYKHIEDNLYDQKDVYGNKDPIPASRAAQMVDKAISMLNELPPEYKDFYSRILISKIESKCFLKENSSNGV